MEFNNFYDIHSSIKDLKSLTLVEFNKLNFFLSLKFLEFTILVYNSLILYLN